MAGKAGSSTRGGGRLWQRADAHTIMEQETDSMATRGQMSASKSCLYRTTSTGWVLPPTDSTVQFPQPSKIAPSAREQVLKTGACEDISDPKH